jgi:hypothetical protein
MTDLAELPWFLVKGNYRGIVPDTLDVGTHPDQFRPWGEVTLTPWQVGPDNRLIAAEPELRLTEAAPPLTVLMLPTTARIETGALRLPRLNAPAGEDVPPTQGQIDAQNAAEGVPLIANDPDDTLELGDKRLAWRVEFGPMTILGVEYRFAGFYFLGPIVAGYDPDAEGPAVEVDLTTVARFVPVP